MAFANKRPWSALARVNSKPNKAGYIKGLIRADMAGGKA
jgi:hypothetical protein